MWGKSQEQDKLLGSIGMDITTRQDVKQKEGCFNKCSTKEDKVVPEDDYSDSDSDEEDESDEEEED